MTAELTRRALLQQIGLDVGQLPPRLAEFLDAAPEETAAEMNALAFALRAYLRREWPSTFAFPVAHSAAKADPNLLGGPARCYLLGPSTTVPDERLVGRIGSFQHLNLLATPHRGEIEFALERVDDDHALARAIYSPSPAFDGFSWPTVLAGAVYATRDGMPICWTGGEPFFPHVGRPGTAIGLRHEVTDAGTGGSVILELRFESR